MQTRVILSAGNISHYHHTALALQEAGRLSDYFCVFNGKNDLGFAQQFLPSDLRKRLAGKSLGGLDAKRIRTFASPYFLTQSMRRIGLIGQARADALFGRLYDRATLYKADDADIFHFVNGMGLRTAQRAKERGRVVLCDVRAEHVDRQEEILMVEYDHLGLPYRSRRALYRDRLTAEYELADFLLVPSSYVAETFIRSGFSSDKVLILPYGVDSSRITSWDMSKEHAKTNHPFRILFVGQVLPLKGVHYLIQALTGLDIPHVELVIIGRGDNEYLRLLNRLIPSKVTIQWLGHIPHMEIWQYYLESDVLVLPSLSDSFGLVVSEAMTAGLPVIVSENTGARDIIQDGVEGFIVPVQDAKGLQEKLAYMYEHPPERREMGHAAMGRVKDFTWERYRERLLDIYEVILDRTGK